MAAGSAVSQVARLTVRPLAGLKDAVNMILTLATVCVPLGTALLGAPPLLAIIVL